MSDESVLDHAIQRQRVVVTLNRRHFVALHTSRANHWGIVVCTFDANFVSLAERIHSVLTGMVGHRNYLLRVNRPE
jgi:hypothetical protein